MKTENKTKNLYFGEDVDEAIVVYLKEKNPKIKSKIFQSKIYPAFERLSTYHYLKFPISRNEEVISECVVHLYEQLHKFDYENNKRGFPYFNIVAKHFFVGKLKSENKQVLQDKELVVSLNDSNSSISEEFFAEDFEEKIENIEFTNITKEHLILWRDKFSKPHEKKVIDAIIDLLENAESVDIFKKKAVFFLLKEYSNLNSKQITTNLNKLKKKFNSLKSKYEKGDI